MQEPLCNRATYNTDWGTCRRLRTDTLKRGVVAYIVLGDAVQRNRAEGSLHGTLSLNHPILSACPDVRVFLECQKLCHQGFVLAPLDASLRKICRIFFFSIIVKLFSTSKVAFKCASCKNLLSVLWPP